MDEIDLLPEGLREQSLSPHEIVLPYQQAVEALAVLVKANWAFLGWEGWVKYPDGRHGHPPGRVIGAVIAREEGEAWADYVQRSAQFCCETMKQEQQDWGTNPADAHLMLYFCLTPTAPEQESA